MRIGVGTVGQKWKDNGRKVGEVGMIDKEKVINQIEVDIQRAERTGEMLVHVGRKTAKDTLALLKEQEQIKSPDEFKSLLLCMFDSIWDVEIDHPVFQDTIGELMEGVLQAYRQAVKWE